jgi:hypothetical protein
MSLDYELGQIENYKEVCYTGEPGERKMSPVTHALIFITMSVDIGRITEKNYLEFYTRAKFAAALFGSSLMKADEHGGYKERGITIEDVRAHIGLHTNVADKTRAYFVKRQVDNYFRSADYDTRQITAAA